MNDDLVASLSTLVSGRYVTQGAESLNAHTKILTRIVSNRKMPAKGLPESAITMLMHELSVMDSNNFIDNVGVGEREGRIYSPIVAQRVFHLAHGIGRSGDVMAEQPKACGSSLLARAAAIMSRDAMRISGMADIGRDVCVLPMATGMTLTMVLMSMRASWANARERDSVIWCRLDQKTCVKAATCAGLNIVVIEPRLCGDELITDVEAIEREIARLGERLVCVVTSTSCFAPRASDDVEAVAKLCEKTNTGHVINNAYGVQSRVICKKISKAWTVGRVDAVVQSTDKNFLVPVGGAIVCCGKRREDLVRAVSTSYPGRASASASIDLFITLLSMGEETWMRLLDEREDVYAYMASELAKVAEEEGERVLSTPGNPISMAMTLSCAKELGMQPTMFGSMLFSRCVSGTRVVAPGETKTVGGIEFEGFGASHSRYPESYFTAAAALGVTRADVDRFTSVLRKTFKDFKKKAAAAAAAASTLAREL
jgi:O-phospho-L-seryl-tRNASec:L-selenocysteinyl-tRNA synthase